MRKRKVMRMMMTRTRQEKKKKKKPGSDDDEGKGRNLEVPEAPDPPLPPRRWRSLSGGKRGKHWWPACLIQTPQRLVSLARSLGWSSLALRGGPGPPAAIPSVRRTCGGI